MLMSVPQSTRIPVASSHKCVSTPTEATDVSVNLDLKTSVDQSSMVSLRVEMPLSVDLHNSLRGSMHANAESS